MEYIDNYLYKVNQSILCERFGYNLQHTRTRAIKVALIDLGIYVYHPYFQKNFLSITGINDDNDWHGTAVAGMITIFGGQDIILTVYHAANGESSSSNIVNYIYNAIEDGNSVINISLSVQLSKTGGRDVIDEWENAIDFAKQNGVKIVVSAGNLGINFDQCETEIIIPAMLRNVITVGAGLSAKKKEKYSNFGSCVDVYVPGGNLISSNNMIVTTTGNNSKMAIELKEGLPTGFIHSLGTSLSAGLVTGYLASTEHLP